VQALEELVAGEVGEGVIQGTHDGLLILDDDDE